MFLPVQVFSSEPAVDNRNFIKYLFMNKRYFDAVSEARRYQYYSKKSEMDYFINVCYYKGEQYGTVIKNINRFNYNGSMDMSELLSYSLIKLNYYDPAYDRAKKIKYNKVDAKRIFRMRYLPLVKSRKFRLLREEVNEAAKYLHNDSNFFLLRKELLEFSELRLHSPFLSSISSAIIPGSGQIYSGKYMDGVISLASVVSTFAGGLYLRKHDREGYGNTMLFFCGLFYAGNIYGAYNSAISYNEGMINNKENNLYRITPAFNPEENIDLNELLK